MRWCDHDGVAADTFQTLFNLVLLDLYSDKGEPVKAERIEVDESSLKTLRRSPHYKAIKSNTKQQFEILRTPREFKDHIRDPITQDRLARRGIRTALFARDARESNKALEIMVDRAMPKTQQKTQDRILVLGEGAARLLLEAEAEAKVIDSTAKEITSGTAVEVLEDED